MTVINYKAQGANPWQVHKGPARNFTIKEMFWMIMLLNAIRVCGMLAIVSGILWLFQWDPDFRK